MSANNIKGNLLEFIVRQLLLNCGFYSVKSDDHYLFDQGGLQFINGKGAAHDADVLVSPPIQLPFAYPTRLLFECKAYRKNTGLNVIRSAIGLRYDINEFEIVTDDSIEQRKRNRSSRYSISFRNRFNYQVGVATIKGVSKPAFEYATNNKIPLLSLTWFLPQDVCSLFDNIDPEYIDTFSNEQLESLTSFLNSKSKQTLTEPGLPNFLDSDLVIGTVLKESFERMEKTFIGLNEYGDMFFLFPGEDHNAFAFDHFLSNSPSQARIHYWTDSPEEWYLSLNQYARDRESSLRFHLPQKYMKSWQEHDFDKTEALNIKQDFFSRIYLFGSLYSEESIPFRILNIDQPWIDGLREEYR